MDTGKVQKVNNVNNAFRY